MIAAGGNRHTASVPERARAASARVAEAMRKRSKCGSSDALAV